jgi:hypothetical protein
MFGKTMISAAVAGVSVVSACGGGRKCGGHGTRHGAKKRIDAAEMAELEEMMAFQQMMNAQKNTTTQTTAPAPTPFAEVAEGKFGSMLDSIDSDSSDSLNLDLPMSFPEDAPVTGAQSPKDGEFDMSMMDDEPQMPQSYPKSYPRSEGKSNGDFTPFEGFTPMHDNSRTPIDAIPMGEGFTAAPAKEEMCYADAEGFTSVMEDDVAMCSAGMCGLDEPMTSSNSTSFASFNSTADAGMCDGGMCGIEEPMTNSAEDMFNNTNTCGTGFAGAMCGLQKNLTNAFDSFMGNSTETQADDMDDSESSDL